MNFKFGTNWSNYSWFVGDIFGAPLAVEGILAFFLESTFIAVMFFGWNKVSRKFHLTSTWLVAIGANLSALWILVANAWMENPVGMVFNPETARNEMVSFWSAWFLIKKREELFARKSILVAGVFGLLSSLLLASELGWILTEMGRQPWIIQDLMPVSIAVSQISTGSVQTTFWPF